MTHGSDFMFEDISKVLLITDMDGTFLPASKIPTPKTLAAVKRFEEAGGRFSIATGRAIQAAACEYSFILSCKAMLFYLSRKKVMCAVGLGNDQQTACIFVYPMDYPRANDAVY